MTLKPAALSHKPFALSRSSLRRCALAKGQGLKAKGCFPMNTRLLSRFLLVLLALSASAGADAISGKVRNLTTGQPATGDEVILLRLGKGMEEETRARADAQGAFTL